MQEHSLEPVSAVRLPCRTLRDWAAIGFRHRRLMAVSFLSILMGAVLVTMLTPPKYHAQVKILVKRERVDPVVSPDPNTQLAMTTDLSEQDMNSEVEIIKSRDLLEKVVVACDLQKLSAPSFLASLLTSREEIAGTDEEVRVVRAVHRLERNLVVTPLRKTKLIMISYGAHDPQLAVKVLRTLVSSYLEKHVAVHRVPGALDFFQSQTEQYREELVEAAEKLAESGQTTGVVAAPMEKELTLRKLNDFDAELRQTHATIAATQQRIRALEEQAASTPPRLATEVRTSDNGLLLQQIKSTLLDLELKRSDLLSKFAPDYRPVQEVEAQIVKAREALAREENSPIREETTDRDATHEWLKQELAGARAELSALQARATSSSQIVSSYRHQARQLNQTEMAQQNLIRTAKAAEDNFLLYSRKQEEARIRDALDQQRIVNVSVAEEATAPALPASPNRALNLALGALLACLVSLGLGYAADHFADTFRTPQEVEVFLNTPVLASLPKD